MYPRAGNPGRGGPTAPAKRGNFPPQIVGENTSNFPPGTFVIQAKFLLYTTVEQLNGALFCPVVFVA
jgi:hypothetical protein